MMFFRPITDQSERARVFERMKEEGLLASAMSSHANPTLDFWMGLTDPDKTVFLGAYDEGMGLMGCATFTKFRGKCCEFDFTAFRDFFPYAVSMAHGAFDWVFTHTDAESIMGLVPVTNRHAYALATRCGFETLGHIKGACFDARKNKHVDAVMLCVTQETLDKVR